ncbi:MAG: energy transducer TonB, partial [Terriglobales bacterium]
PASIAKRRHYTYADGYLVKALSAIRDEARLFGASPELGPLRIVVPPAAGPVAEPRRTKYVAPVYPPVAQAARIEGQVLMDVIVDVAGKVKAVRVTKSTPVMDQAAVDAVRRWEYSPALLNGTAVEVVMSTTVIFSIR